MDNLVNDITIKIDWSSIEKFLEESPIIGVVTLTAGILGSLYFLTRFYQMSKGVIERYDL